jgi:hypothetical protein
VPAAVNWLTQPEVAKLVGCPVCPVPRSAEPGQRVVAADAVPGLAPPVGYEHPWGWVAIGLVVVVVVWHLAVWWVTREPSAAGGAARRPDRLPSPARSRGRALEALAEIERDLATGRCDLRTAHHRMSAVVRGFVEEVSDLPARSMALGDLREAGARDLAAAVEAMYPPEFAPDAGPEAGRTSSDRFTDTLALARDLVSSWR